jgi:hypothetical protein
MGTRRRIIKELWTLKKMVKKKQKTAKKSALKKKLKPTKKCCGRSPSDKSKESKVQKLIKFAKSKLKR